jgi:hypothetical protein
MIFRYDPKYGDNDQTAHDLLKSKNVRNCGFASFNGCFDTEVHLLQRINLYAQMMLVTKSSDLEENAIVICTSSHVFSNYVLVLGTCLLFYQDENLLQINSIFSRLTSFPGDSKFKQPSVVIHDYWQALSLAKELGWLTSLNDRVYLGNSKPGAVGQDDKSCRGGLHILVPSDLLGPHLFWSFIWIG